MQTVLGANGPIAEELVHYLHEEVTDEIRLVSRNPSRMYDTDQLVRADLMDPDAADHAVRGSDIAYLTVGLPMDSAVWEERFPVMMANTIAACRNNDCKLVFFDNTYMLPRTAAPQTESTAFDPHGRKSRVRAQVASMLLAEMAAGRIEALICRAPEFYGPGKTKSLTNSLVFDRIEAGKRPLVPGSANTVRSLIWTPDASRAMGLLGNSVDAYGQTWHLPIDSNRRTYRELIDIAASRVGRPISYTAIPITAFRVAGLVNAAADEAWELMPRYKVDNIFDSSKFDARFPAFGVTTYEEGITALLG